MDADNNEKQWGRRMSDELIFTRGDSDRIVRLEEQTIQQTALLNLILAQTTKTNGRVSLLETRSELLENTNAATSGAKWMLGVMFGAVATIVGLWIAYKYH